MKIKATHYYTEDYSFYESQYVVHNGEITHYRIKGEVWRFPNLDNKYERLPKVEDLKEIQ